MAKQSIDRDLKVRTAFAKFCNDIHVLDYLEGSSSFLDSFFGNWTVSRGRPDDCRRHWYSIMLYPAASITNAVPSFGLRLMRFPFIFSGDEHYPLRPVEIT